MGSGKTIVGALVAQRATEIANGEAQRAAARRALTLLLKAFPNCTLGDGSTAALESAVNCFSQAFDGAKHQGTTVDASGHIVWNDKNPNVRKFHDQFNAYAKAQSADEALLRSVESQPASQGRDMRVLAIKDRINGRSTKMDFLIYQARTATP